MYSNSNTAESYWILKHCVNENSEISGFMNDPEKFGANAHNILPFSAIQYSMKGISVVVDYNCMSEGLAKDFKYLVLEKTANFIPGGMIRQVSFFDINIAVPVLFIRLHLVWG